MCRNIRKLRNPERAPSDGELEDAALQFIRKVSGYRVPSQKNREAFERAVNEVALATRRMFDELAPVVAARKAEAEAIAAHVAA